MYRYSFKPKKIQRDTFEYVGPLLEGQNYLGSSVLLTIEMAKSERLSFSRLSSPPPFAAVDHPRCPSVGTSSRERSVPSAIDGRVTYGDVAESRRCRLIRVAVCPDPFGESPPRRGMSAGLVRVNKMTLKNPDREKTMSANVVTANGTFSSWNAENRAAATGTVVIV